MSPDVFVTYLPGHSTSAGAPFPEFSPATVLSPVLKFVNR